MANKNTIVVEQIGSPIRREAAQRQTLIGLGLNKCHRQKTLEDTPSIRGMIHRVRHLVRIVEGDMPKTTDKIVEGDQPKTTSKKVKDDKLETKNIKVEDNKSKTPNNKVEKKK